jgi:hypothetical protein
MMYEGGKSASAIVAVKPTNKAGQPAAEPVEPRAGTEGKAGQQTTLRAQNRVSVSNALDRIRQAAGKGRRNGSRRSSTMSASICSGLHSSRSNGKRHPE